MVVRACVFAHPRVVYLHATMFAMCRKLQAMVFGEGGGGGGREREEGQKEPPLVAGEPQRRFFSGEITSLTDTSGMIDHQVRPRLIT